MVTRTPSLPLARSGGYATPRYSGDHWKSGKEISLSSPPFNFRNFGFGFGFPKVDFFAVGGFVLVFVKLLWVLVVVWIVIVIVIFALILFLGCC
jgi:hypothetical protein